MIDSYCEMAFDHEPGTTCEYCKLEVDQYGNTEGDFRNCPFPDCGCDGARLCMAPNGPSEVSMKGNVEGMYNGNSPEQRKARMDLIGLCCTKKKESDG